MRLTPLPDPAKRAAKVVKHWFDHRERWWEVDGDLPAWSADWHVVRGAGAVHGHPVPPNTPAAEVVAAAHDRWRGAAERACDQARERRTVYPTDRRDRVCYVGWPGVLVIVAQEAALVTAFRVVPPVRRTDPRAFDQAAVHRAKVRAGLADRRAVRDGVRRASLFQRIPE